MDKTWKVWERKLAGWIGATRQVGSGSCNQKGRSTSDSTHPRIYLEVKYRAKTGIVSNVRGLSTQIALLVDKKGNYVAWISSPWDFPPTDFCGHKVFISESVCPQWIINLWDDTKVKASNEGKIPMLAIVERRLGPVVIFDDSNINEINQYIKPYRKDGKYE